MVFIILFLVTNPLFSTFLFINTSHYFNMAVCNDQDLTDFQDMGRNIDQLNQGISDMSKRLTADMVG